MNNAATTTDATFSAISNNLRGAEITDQGIDDGMAWMAIRTAADIAVYVTHVGDENYETTFVLPNRKSMTRVAGPADTENIVIDSFTLTLD